MRPLFGWYACPPALVLACRAGLPSLLACSLRVFRDRLLRFRWCAGNTSPCGRRSCLVARLRALFQLPIFIPAKSPFVCVPCVSVRLAGWSFPCWLVVSTYANDRSVTRRAGGILASSLVSQCINKTAALVLRCFAYYLMRFRYFRQRLQRIPAFVTRARRAFTFERSALFLRAYALAVWSFVAIASRNPLQRAIVRDS